MSTSALASRRSQDRLTWSGRADRWVRGLAWVALAICALVAVGWYARVEPLTRLTPAPVSMKLNTAVVCGLLATARLTPVRRARQVLLGLVLLFGVLVLAEYAAGVDVGIDELLVLDWAAVGTESRGRPAASTGLCLVVLGMAGLANDLRRRVAAQALATLPLLAGALSAYHYLYGVSPLSAIENIWMMSPAAAVVIALLSLAELTATPNGLLQWIVFGADPGATLQRLLIPVAALVLPVGGWLVVQGQRQELYTPEFGTVLLVGFGTVVVIALAMWTGRTALGIDDAREALLDQLGAANYQLEDSVRARSRQLHRQRTKLVVLEERDRIARDLHDRVIQRIFAAGLQLSALSRRQRKAATAGAPAESVAEGLDGIAIELDLAIRELRNSIFELSSGDDHEDVDRVVRDIVSRASRILGYLPRVKVSGEVATISPDLIAQVASVIQEGLSNIARHAHASAAEVVLRATPEHIEVSISDDGDGMPEPLPRSSGISNLISRARDLGGTATWRSNAPFGTTFVWEVPHDGSSAGYANRTPVAFSDRLHRPAASAGF